MTNKQGSKVVVGGFTPGPWMVLDGVPSGGGIGIGPVIEAIGGPHALVCFNGGESEANAALIAAAPELLEALKKLVLRCEHDRKCSWKEYGPASDKPCNCGMHQADEAISKAEGVIGGNSWL